MSTSPEDPRPHDPVVAHELVSRLFAATLDLQGPDRRAFLAEACGDDAELRAEVESLLERDAALERGGTVEAARARQAILGALDAEAGDDAESGAGEYGGSLRPGDTLGPYVLSEVLGEGTFGTVFAAEQAAPLRRAVAIKVLKAGMDTREVVARFEAERHALSRMDHPNIARVHDAGATPNGRPFFVMERVEGVDVTTFCDRERLSLRDRLRLFLDICAAVQHAHQKGVIHRDLKPSNILVTLRDGRPVPKVIDFGIAKATHQPLGEQAVSTLQGQILGTPEYMSPEQAEMNDVGVDTTTDIYALGVVLYELLTGVLPFDPALLRRRGLAEIHRVLREEPPKPSTRVSTLGPATASIGERRRVEPHRLKSELSGDLDWIVMRALEKQPARRYPSASEFAADVRRHLEHEPVLAGPPTTGYRLRKFVRRNRVGVGVAIGAALLLLSGVVGTTVGMLEADRARVAAEGARAHADDETARARAVTDFLLETLGLADPDVTELPEMTMADALDAAAAEVGEAFAEFPASEAEVRLVIGRAYFTLGRPDLAQPHLLRALDLHRNVLHSDARLLLDTLRVLWQVSNRIGDLAWMVQARESSELNLVIIGRTDADLARRFEALTAQAQNPFAPVDRIRAEWDELAVLARAHVDAGRLRWGDVSAALMSPAIWMGWRGGNEAAAEMLEELAETSPDPLPNPRLRLLMEHALHFRLRAGDFAGAIAMAEQRIARLAEMLGEDHWYLEVYRFILAGGLVGEGRLDEALPILERCLAVFEGSSAPNLWEVMAVRTKLAELHEAAGRPELAAPHRQALLEYAVRSPDGYIWDAQREMFSPAYSEARDAIDAFDALVRRCLSRDESFSAHAEEFRRLVEDMLSARRGCCEDEELVAVPLSDHVGQRSRILLHADGLEADGEAMLRDAYRVSRLHRAVRPWRCLLHAGELYDHLNVMGRVEEARALGSEIDTLVADDLPPASAWKTFRGLNGNDMIWFLVKGPGLSPETFDFCARFAKVALGSALDRDAYLNTTGVALYRAGRYEEALDYLQRSDRRVRPEAPLGLVEDLAFLAMTHHRLGQAREASESMDRLRAALAAERQAPPARERAFLAEAEDLLAAGR